MLYCATYVREIALIFCWRERGDLSLFPMNGRKCAIFPELICSIGGTRWVCLVEPKILWNLLGWCQPMPTWALTLPLQSVWKRHELQSESGVVTLAQHCDRTAAPLAVPHSGAGLDAPRFVWQQPAHGGSIFNTDSRADGSCFDRDFQCCREWGYKIHGSRKGHGCS